MPDWKELIRLRMQPPPQPKRMKLSKSYRRIWKRLTATCWIADTRLRRHSNVRCKKSTTGTFFVDESPGQGKGEIR